MSDPVDTIPAMTRRSRREESAPDVVDLPWNQSARTLSGWPTAQLIVAGVTMIVALGGGFAVSILLGGAFGAGVGAALAAAVLGIVAIVILVRWPVPGLFAVRMVDVAAGLVLGLLLPFLAGLLLPIFGQPVGWPALEALSPRWLALAVLTPIAGAVVLQLFWNGLLLVGVSALVSRRTASRGVTGAVAVLVSTLAAFGYAALFRDDMLGMPVILALSLALACALFTVWTGRLWGAIITAAVFVVVWVGLSALGLLLQ